MRKFKNSFEFFEECISVFNSLIQSQLPELQQASPIYHFYLQLLAKFSPGNNFLKPGTLDYYAIDDYDVDILGVDERNLFIEDMKASESIIHFIGHNHRPYKITEDHLIHMRRIYLYKENIKNLNAN